MIGRGLAVIFDMDGVLVDSYRAHLESWQSTAKSFGVEMSEADFARTFGRTSREVIATLWPEQFGPTTDDAANRIAAFDAAKEEAYRQILQRRFPEMAGASELIAALHQAGFALGIGSSGPQKNVEVVRRCIRNGDHFTGVVHGGEVTRGKPAPDVFLLVAKKLGIEPSKCAVIEDAPVGLRAARSAGMAAIGLTGTAPPEELAKHAHRVVTSLSMLNAKEITELIESSSAR